MPKRGFYKSGISEASLRPSTAVAYARRYKKPLQVLHMNEAKLSKRGSNHIGIYTTVEVSDVADCSHYTTLCDMCAPQWFADYIVRSFLHSLTGYSKGCRCEVCLGPSKIVDSRRRREQV